MPSCFPGFLIRLLSDPLDDGDDSRCFEGSSLRLVGDQFAQERNQHDERNTDRQAAGAELREKFCVLGLRCDRCGAQAYIRVTLPSGGELLFCAHHGRAHETKLREVSSSYQDQTEQLVATTPGTASESER